MAWPIGNNFDNTSWFSALLGASATPESVSSSSSSSAVGPTFFPSMFNLGFLPYFGGYPLLNPFYTNPWSAVATPVNSSATSVTGGGTASASDKQILEAFQKAEPKAYANLVKENPHLPDEISAVANHFGVNLKLLLTSLTIETNGNNNLTSSAGAKGLNQIMPAAYDNVVNLIKSGKVKLPQGVSLEALSNYKTDPVANTIVSAIYLKEVVAPQLKIFDMRTLSDEQIKSALGAYNEGPYGFTKGDGHPSETVAHMDKAGKVLGAMNQAIARA